MNYPLAFIFGILPSIIWLIFYLRRDLHPEPKRMILKIFVLGMLATVPAIFIELALRCLFQFTFSPYAAAFPTCFTSPAPLSPAVHLVYILLGVALVEELLKYGVVRWQVYSSPAFDEPIDLPLYMIVSALGFAALENVLLFSGLGPASLASDIFVLSIFRFIGATFLHALVSGLFGYFLVLAIFQKRFYWVSLLVGLGLAVLLHGLFNFYIIELDFPEKVVLPAAILIGLATFISLMLKKLQQFPPQGNS